MADHTHHEILLLGGPMDGQSLDSPLISARLWIPGEDGWYTLKAEEGNTASPRRILTYLWQESS